MKRGKVTLRWPTFMRLVDGHFDVTCLLAVTGRVSTLSDALVIDSVPFQLLSITKPCKLLFQDFWKPLPVFWKIDRVAELAGRADKDKKCGDGGDFDRRT